MTKILTEFSKKYTRRGCIAISNPDIRNEPMIYGGSWDWCRTMAGPITQAVMDKIEPSLAFIAHRQAMMGYHPVIDTKSVLLMPGQFACIPGWHCDGVIRSERGTQPDIHTVHAPVKHFACVISENDHAGTEFLQDKVTVLVDSNNVWSSVNKHLEDVGGNTYKAKSGDIVEFERQQLHRCPPAKSRGWRYFFRLSFYHMPAANEIRKQVQVYTDATGW